MYCLQKKDKFEYLKLYHLLSELYKCLAKPVEYVVLIKLYLALRDFLKLLTKLMLYIKELYIIMTRSQNILLLIT